MEHTAPKNETSASTHLFWLFLVMPIAVAWVYAFTQGREGDVFDAACFYLLQSVAYVWLLVQFKRKPIDSAGQVQRASLVFFFVYLFSWLIAATSFMWISLPRAGDGGGSPVMAYFVMMPLCLLIAVIASIIKVNQNALQNST